jgi:hypothetical protein
MNALMLVLLFAIDAGDLSRQLPQVPAVETQYPKEGSVNTLRIQSIRLRLIIGGGTSTGYSWDEPPRKKIFPR